ncbi:MAG: methyltransferase family protein [Dehalococcoidia bacterium]
MNTAFAWGLAAISIVVVSWIFYRYVAPKSWREWTRAGLVQAFLIAFYAEMYGFPLTIYLLTRFFGLDVALTGSRNFWSQLFDLGELPMLVAMTIGYVFFVIPGVGLLGKGWREIYYARREGRLAIDGLYGVVRHPQYTGIFLAIFGEGIVHWPTLISVAMFPVIVIAYVLLARKEERQMLAEYGDRYRDYQRRVPMFFPRWGEWRRLLGELTPASRKRT